MTTIPKKGVKGDIHYDLIERKTYQFDGTEWVVRTVYNESCHEDNNALLIDDATESDTYKLKTGEGLTAAPEFTGFEIAQPLDHSFEILIKTDDEHMIRFFNNNKETLAVNCQTGELTFGDESTIEDQYREAWITFINVIRVMSPAPDPVLLEPSPPQPKEDPRIAYERAMGTVK